MYSSSIYQYGTAQRFAAFLLFFAGIWSENAIFAFCKPACLPDFILVSSGRYAQHRERMTKIVYFAGGCFWGTEHYLKKIRGVEDTQVGYANGKLSNPTYEEVCTDTTGFAETVKVVYNPEILPLPRLLELFFMAIDPTTANRQGHDVGTQYRTGVYYTDEADKGVILAALERLNEECDGRSVVECSPLQNFYDAEDYHQDYLDKNPMGYCHLSPELFRFAEQANAPK